MYSWASGDKDFLEIGMPNNPNLYNGKKEKYYQFLNKMMDYIFLILSIIYFL